MDPVQLPVQSHAAARRINSVRLHLIGLAGRPADRRRKISGGSGPARRAGLRERASRRAPHRFMNERLEKIFAAIVPGESEVVGRVVGASDPAKVGTTIEGPRY